MFKQLATATAAIALGFGAFTAPAQAYTKICGSSSIAFEQSRNSPRYFNGAETVQIHASGNVSYHMPSGYFLSVKGRWHWANNGHSIVVVNPDGTTHTFNGVKGACHRYF